MGPGTHRGGGFMCFVVAVVVVGGCGSSDGPRDSSPAAGSVRPVSTTGASTTGTTPTPSVPTAAAPVATTAPEPVFVSRVDEIGPDVRARMDGRSMRPGCPVGYNGLVLLTMSYVGFDGADHTGEMVVSRDVADDVVSVFRTLHDQRLPIRRMSLVDDFGPGPTPAEGADDNASMAADNTSAFNCRNVAGSSRPSEHSFGTAIDLNPLENPYVMRDGTVVPPAGRDFLDRTSGAPGVIGPDSPVAAAFASIGWRWGGDWSGGKDYQHFSRSGR